MKNPWFCWHKWERWSEPRDLLRTTYLRGEVIKKKVIGQSQECEKCGKIRLRAISEDS